MAKEKKCYFFVTASGKVTDINSLKAADTVLKCFIVLQDENLFSHNNVIFMQFLLKEMHCEELYEKCIQFAQEQEALCFFFKPPGIFNYCIEYQK